MSNAPSNKKTKSFPQDTDGARRFDIFRHQIHTMSGRARNGTNIAFVGLEGSGKTSCVRTFIKSLYPVHAGWKHKESKKILHIPLTQRITLWDVPSTVEIGSLSAKRGPKPTMFALVIKPSQVRKAETLAKLGEILKKFVETSRTILFVDSTETRFLIIVTKLDKEKPYALRKLFRETAALCGVDKDRILPFKNCTETFSDVVIYCAIRCLVKLVQEATVLPLVNG
jgi:GTPase SAR1 family protein